MATRKKAAEQPAPSREAASKPAKPVAKASARQDKPAVKATAATKPAKAAAASAAAPKKAPAAKKAAPTPAPADKSTGAAAIDKEGAKAIFSPKFLETQQKKLLEERARYLASAQTWKAEADSLLLDRDPGDVQFDEESGDGDTLQMERERDLALSSYARAAVEEIDEALARIKAGTYGYCVTSGKPIPKERLEAIPWASERVEYKVAGFRKK